MITGDHTRVRVRAHVVIHFVRTNSVVNRASIFKKSPTHHASVVSPRVCIVIIHHRFQIPSVLFPRSVSFRFVEPTTGVDDAAAADDGSWEREREDKIDNRTRGVSRALKRTNERDEHDARVETFGLR